MGRAMCWSSGPAITSAKEKKSMKSERCGMIFLPDLSISIPNNSSRLILKSQNFSPIFLVRTSLTNFLNVKIVFVRVSTALLFLCNT